MYAGNKARTNLIRSIRYTDRALYHRKGTSDRPGRFSTPSFRHTDVTSVLSQVGIIRADKPAKLRPRDKIETGGPSFCSFSNFTRREFSSFAFDRGGIHLGFAVARLPTHLRLKYVSTNETVLKAKSGTGRNLFCYPCDGGYFGFSATTAPFFFVSIRAERIFGQARVCFFWKERENKC